MSDDVKPQVIKRGGKYVVHNVELDPLTKLRKLALAVMVWDQVRVLMEINGEYKPRDPSVSRRPSAIGSTDDVDREAALSVGLTEYSSLNKVRPRLSQRADVLEKVWNGEITSMHDTARALGMRMRVKLEEGASSKARFKSSYYGSGDKFIEATEPLTRYLTAWKKKGFRYPHVPPREAQKRIVKIDQMIDDLTQAREDLLQRSHVARLAAPSEKKGRTPR